MTCASLLTGRARGFLVPVLAAVVMMAGACTQDGYQIQFKDDGAVLDGSGLTDGALDGVKRDGVGDGPHDGRSGDSDACFPSNEGKEICDGLDNDCNGKVDDVDPSLLETDGDNCGECGKPCVIANAFAQCVAGKCQLDACAPGYYDINKDPKDGCEYQCLVSNSGVELCDGADNNCDGQIDEGFDKQTDADNCGKCGQRCLYSNGVGACQAGVCALASCAAGFADLNKLDGDGCEYKCPVWPTTTEQCSGKDDDCDGLIDEGLPGTGDPCDTGKLGVCKDGETQCTGGKIECVAKATASQEICDNKDNDCNGTVDDGFDLTKNVLHCGVCNKVCSFPNAIPKCENKVCMIDRCQNGYADLDPAAPGCEHQCEVFPTVAETCNGKDDNCDGKVDEGFDLQTDPNNCKTCGNVCSFPNATASCVAGVCTMGKCNPDYYDIDPAAPGCEYPCLKSNGGTEICDQADNNCNGQIDEGFDLQGDVNNCGSCGNVCQFNNAAASCVKGKCVQGACATGFRDFDPAVAGCEYKCPIWPPASDETSLASRCDGVDNDCDGATDEDFPTGAACGSSTGTCTAGTLSCQNGVESCSGAQGPTAEVCDGQDNNCDGNIDEGFDKLNDPRYCENCAGCNLPHAIAKCVGGSCSVAVCEQGWVDNDPTRPGCEYQCTPTGVEICDGKDNDCDGGVDNGLTAPTGMCLTLGPCAGAAATCQGALGWVCAYNADVELLPCTTNADCGGSVPCTAGVCPGIVNTNEQRCDGKDGDCDGVADDPWTGASLPQALGKACVPDPSVQGICRAQGVYACNATQDNVYCKQTQAGQTATAEVCNGKDDDCDGKIDEPEDDAGGKGVVDAAVRVQRTVGGTPYDFYVWSYEASRPDATASTPGGTGARACSKAGVLPWGSVTYAQAQAACAAASPATCGQPGQPSCWRLCTADEWRVACEGATQNLYPYGASYQANSCNGVDHGVGQPLAAGSLATCQGGETGLFDMSGNVREWTNDPRGTTGGGTPKTIYAVRGGAYHTPALGLSCTFALSQAVEDVVLPAIGFRCCRTGP